MAEKYDVVVIGAGPAGYVAAIRAAQLGLSTACVEQWLDDERQSPPRRYLPQCGLHTVQGPAGQQLQVCRGQGSSGCARYQRTGASIDVPAMLARKDKIVEQLTGGIAGLFKHNGVTAISGTGKVLAGTRVEVTDKDGKVQVLAAGNIIIAAGSLPVAIPPAPIDNEYIIDSTGALELTEVPRRLGVIGAGVIGLELGSVWARLGSEVVMLEALDEFLPMMDVQIAKEAGKDLQEAGPRYPPGHPGHRRHGEGWRRGGDLQHRGR